MQELLILIVFYILYLLFSALANRQRKQAATGKASQRTAPLKPPQPRAGTSPSPEPTLAEEKEPQLELPPFLRQMLGLGEPEKPRPAAESIPEDVGQKEEPAAESPGLPPGGVAEAEPPAPLVQGPDVQLSPALQDKAALHSLRQLVRKKSTLRQAYILKEILDAPLSKRPRQFFKTMR